MSNPEAVLPSEAVSSPEDDTPPGVLGLLCRAIVGWVKGFWKEITYDDGRGVDQVCEQTNISRDQLN